jgi:hypothetical protein
MPESAVPLDLTPCRGAVAAAFFCPAFSAALKTFLAGEIPPEAETLLDRRNRLVALTLPDAAGRNVPAVVKEFRLRGLKKILSFGRASKAEKAWRGALALADRGFLTPAPIAFLDHRRRGFVERSVFVAARLAEGREIRCLFRDSAEPEIKAILARLAPVLRSLHDAGLVHRDLSDGNLLVREDGNGEAFFFFLDTNRVRRRRRVGTFGRARALVRLGVPRGLRPFFLERYAAAPASPGASALGRSFAFWYRAGKWAFSTWVAAKKALRLRKIARALRLQ